MQLPANKLKQYRKLIDKYEKQIRSDLARLNKGKTTKYLDEWTYIGDILDYLRMCKASKKETKDNKLYDLLWDRDTAAREAIPQYLWDFFDDWNENPHA